MSHASLDINLNPGEDFIYFFLITDYPCKGNDSIKNKSFKQIGNDILASNHNFSNLENKKTSHKVAQNVQNTKIQRLLDNQTNIGITLYISDRNDCITYTYKNSSTNYCLEEFLKLN